MIPLLLFLEHTLCGLIEEERFCCLSSIILSRILGLLLLSLSGKGSRRQRKNNRRRVVVLAVVKKRIWGRLQGVVFIPPKSQEMYLGGVRLSRTILPLVTLRTQGPLL